MSSVVKIDGIDYLKTRIVPYFFVLNFRITNHKKLKKFQESIVKRDKCNTTVLLLSNYLSVKPLVGNV